MYLIQDYFHLQYFVCVFIALFLDLPTITMHNYIYIKQGFGWHLDQLICCNCC